MLTGDHVVLGAAAGGDLCRRAADHALGLERVGRAHAHGATTASTSPLSRAACMSAVATPPDAPACRIAGSDAQPNQSGRQGPRKSSLGAPSLRSRHQAPGEKSRPGPGHASRQRPQSVHAAHRRSGGSPRAGPTSARPPPWGRRPRRCRTACRGHRRRRAGRSSCGKHPSHSGTLSSAGRELPCLRQLLRDAVDAAAAVADHRARHADDLVVGDDLAQALERRRRRPRSRRSARSARRWRSTS